MPTVCHRRGCKGRKRYITDGRPVGLHTMPGRMPKEEKKRQREQAKRSPKARVQPNPFDVANADPKQQIRQEPDEGRLTAVDLQELEERRALLFVGVRPLKLQ